MTKDFFRWSPQTPTTGYFLATLRVAEISQLYEWGVHSASRFLREKLADWIVCENGQTVGFTLFAHLLCDQISGQPVSIGVPVSVPQIASESVQEDLVLIRIALHWLRQVDKVDLLASCQRL